MLMKLLSQINVEKVTIQSENEVSFLNINFPEDMKKIGSTKNRK